MSADTFLPTLTPQSSCAEVPMWEVRLPVTARGHDFDQVLRRDPDLPGIVVFDTTGVRGAISRARFQQVISRPFGGEIVRPRAIGSWLEELSSGALMVLDVNMPVQDALRESLGRDKSMIYEPVLISANGGKDVRLGGFSELLRARSRISPPRSGTSRCRRSWRRSRKASSSSTATTESPGSTHDQWRRSWAGPTSQAGGFPSSCAISSVTNRPSWPTATSTHSSTPM